MAKFSISGQVTAILEPRQGNGYQLQEIEVAEVTNYNGQELRNLYRVAFKNQRMAMLSQIRPGVMVNIDGFINSVTKEPQPGNVFYNYYLNGFNIAPMQQGYAQQPPQYRQGPNGQQFEVYQQQPQTTYQPQAPYGQQAPQLAPLQQGNAPGELPW